MRTRLFGPGAIETPAQLAANIGGEGTTAPVRPQGASQRTADAQSVKALLPEIRADWERAVVVDVTGSWRSRVHLTHIRALGRLIERGLLDHEDLDVGEREGMQITVIRRNANGSREVLVTQGRHAYRIRRGAEIEAPTAAGAYRTAAGADQFWFVRRWRFSEMTEADRTRAWSTTEFPPHEIHFEDGNRLMRMHDERMEGLGVVWEHRDPNQERGLRWSTPINRSMNWQEATDAAAALNRSHPGDRPARLPTKEEFEEIAKNPELFRFLFRRGVDNRWYWSSSVHPNVASVAYVLYGLNGYVDYDYRNISYNCGARFVR